MAFSSYDESVQGHRAAFAWPLANDPHQRHRLRVLRQWLSGRAAMGRASATDFCKPVAEHRLSYAIFFAWQGVVFATAVGILLGQAQGLEWGETPVWIDPVALAGTVARRDQFHGADRQVERSALCLPLVFHGRLRVDLSHLRDGQFHAPVFRCRELRAGAVGGLFIHDLVGLFVTPLGWGLMYYFVPIMLKKPIWSHGLSLVGFWGLAFFYPLQGIHHFLYTPIPMFLQYGAIISTIAVELVVTTVIVNFFMTIEGTGARSSPTCRSAGSIRA